MYYVYELINLMGGVDYVGHSDNPNGRFIQHTQRKPQGRSIGKFYGRQDLLVNIVSAHPTRTEAKREEMRLQKFWGFKTEDEKNRSNQKNLKLTEDKVKEIKVLLQQEIPQREIAKRFGISKRSVLFIKQGKSWTHVK